MGEIDTKMIDYDKLEPDLYRFAHWFSEKQLITMHSFPLRLIWSNLCQSLISLSGTGAPNSCWMKWYATSGWQTNELLLGKHDECWPLETPNSNKTIACIESVHYTSIHHAALVFLQCCALSHSDENMLLFCSEFINVNLQLNDFQHVLCQISCINGLQVLSRKRGMIVGAFAGRVKVQVNPQGSLRWPNGIQWLVLSTPFYL